MVDVTLQYNPETGRQRIVLENGEPVPDEQHGHELLSMFYEDPGWPMEETPRQGNIGRQFQEHTSGTRSRFKSEAERRAQPLISDGLLTDAECDSVDIDTRQGILTFDMLVQRTGREPESVVVELAKP